MVQGTVSVIIPAHNAAATLTRCLSSVCAQDDEDYEVIVIDDGSSDATAAVCAKFDVDMIRNDEQMGPAVSRNRGADAARGEILAFTDADCVPPVDWLRNIRSWLEVAPVVGGTYQPAPWQNALGRFANLDWHLYWFRFIPAETDSFSMGNVAFKREVYFDRERLEEYFFRRTAAAEDTVLAMTIAERHRILSTDQLWVLHMHRDNLWAYIRKHITTGYSRTLLSMAFPRRKVFGARDIRLSYVLPQLLFTAALLIAFVPGGVPLVIATVLFIASQVPSLMYIWRRERSVGFLLMSLVLFAIRNTAWTLGIAKAVVYLASRPPEIEAAARWRAARKAQPTRSESWTDPAESESDTRQEQSEAGSNATRLG
jgi:glycosyltransferase involved in cell wall biosynthesis